MEKIFTLLLLVIFTSTTSFAQNAQYDVRLELESCNCCTNQILANLYIRASSPDATFRIAFQRYYFSFNPNAIEGMEVISEGTIGGIIAPTEGDFGFYGPHAILPDPLVDSLVGYDVPFSGNYSLLIETEWVHIGTLALNVLDINVPLDLNWLTQSDWPRTDVYEFTTEFEYETVAEGMYINNISLNTFADCSCPLGYDAVTLTSQQDVNDFAVNYPDLSVANLTIESSEDVVMDLTPLNVISSVERLSIINNNALNNLIGLENIISIACELTIVNNPQLNTCNVFGICDYLENGGVATISDNADGCNNDMEVIQSCFLPVEMSLPLQVRLQDQVVILTWQTETETNNTGFEIQKSKDGIEWERVGWQVGQGNTYTPHTYTYLDENPFSNTSYYRLKQVDFGGKFSYSNITSLEYIRPHINIYPNPAKDKLYINVNEQIIDKILVFDTMGKQIKTQLISNEIDVSLLSKGLYTVKVIIGGQYFCEKIVVE